ncbi:MAG: Holliday junction resolvase RuvX [Acidobacteriota bacterium]
MRLLGIDLGSKNIGIAVSDGLGITVRPVETIRRSSLNRDLERLQFLIADLEVEGVVIGLPLKMDGSEGDAAEKVLQFIKQLGAKIDIPIFTQDERLTSYEAEQLMMERGWNRQQRKSRSDEIAAMIILQDYLSQTTKNS